MDKLSPFSNPKVLAWDILQLCGVDDLTSLNGCKRYFIEYNGLNGCKSISTMQGFVYSAIDLVNGTRVIIKCSSKSLTQKNFISKNESILWEDICNEAKILKYISNTSTIGISSGICRFVDFFQDDKYYYLVTQHGGNELFSYITQNHPNCKQQNKSNRLNKLNRSKGLEYGVNSLKNVNNNIIDTIETWKKSMQSFFGVIARSVYFLHVDKNIAHLDLSLENIVIDNKTGKVKLIDFGLAQYFGNNKWKYGAYGGKVPYQAPEIRSIKLFLELSQRHQNNNHSYDGNNQNNGKLNVLHDSKCIPDWLCYDARSVDIWALGVILFTMLTGFQPWHAAEPSHKSFNLIMNGNIDIVLKHWNCLQFVDTDALDLMKKIFTSEDRRIDIKRIIGHKYVKYCIMDNNNTIND